MPDLIRHPVLPLDAGVRRNDKHKVFIHRINSEESWPIRPSIGLPAEGLIYLWNDKGGYLLFDISY